MQALKISIRTFGLILGNVLHVINSTFCHRRENLFGLDQVFSIFRKINILTPIFAIPRMYPNPENEHFGRENDKNSRKNLELPMVYRP